MITFKWHCFKKMHIFIWKEIFIIESKMAKIRSIRIIFEMLSCRKLIGHENAYLAEKMVNVKVEVLIHSLGRNWQMIITWTKRILFFLNSFCTKSSHQVLEVENPLSHHILYIKTIFEKFCNMVFSGKFTKTCIVNMSLRLDI